MPEATVPPADGVDGVDGAGHAAGRRPRTGGARRPALLALLALAVSVLAALGLPALAQAGLPAVQLAAMAGAALVAVGAGAALRRPGRAQDSRTAGAPAPAAPAARDAHVEINALHGIAETVRATAAGIASASALVDGHATALLAHSVGQLQQIGAAGRAVHEMAARIDAVSQQAQQSAQAARHSLQATASGMDAVQDAIGGMDAIRAQIQDTAKRIKRLGESSQEIGEITELIADITEQTNVLALNAAIQAASAGEAGRGFAVVAEEVQRLAGRSADATRQIAALVQAIQADMQDTVAAMERATRDVVAGTRLTHGAGTALQEIDRVSRQLAECIDRICGASQREAERAGEVARGIQHISAEAGPAGDAPRATAEQVRELASLADTLRRCADRLPT